MALAGTHATPAVGAKHAQLRVWRVHIHWELVHVMEVRAAEQAMPCHTERRKARGWGEITAVAEHAVVAVAAKVGVATVEVGLVEVMAVEVREGVVMVEVETVEVAMAVEEKAEVVRVAAEKAAAVKD